MTLQIKQNKYELCRFFVINIIFISLNKFEILVKNITEKGVEKMFDKICLALIIIGALNWGLVGIFQFDLVAWLFGGTAAIISRIVYTVIALAGIWCISLLFRRNNEI